ncbi:serine/threonine-protein kinase [Corchorus olitorius]|uniref:Serine/threonine-protein kinase n=1 Tax=Corchorus olitorius TaxID=93759 RepID=A0A1R3H2Q3_9ROSI|nr:serine/threonine-protein kinase [Corchorus olitorius]
MASSTSSTPLSTLTIQTIAQISAMVTDELTTKNYNTLQHQVLPLIEGNSMANHILADSKAPTATIVANSGKEEQNHAFSICQQEDRLVKSLINATLSSKVCPFTVGLSTAREIWKILEDQFANSSKQ